MALFYKVIKKLALYRFGRMVARTVFRLYYRMDVSGLENVTNEGKYILASNHRTYADPVFMAGWVKNRYVRFMAKDTLFNSKFKNFFFRGLGAFPVARGKGDSGALDTAVQFIEEGDLLGIFPEGTRSKDGKLGRGRSGISFIAHQTKADVVPIGISYSGKLSFRKKVKVRFGKPIPNADLHLDEITPSNLKHSNKLIMSRIAELMEE